MHSDESKNDKHWSRRDRSKNQNESADNASRKRQDSKSPGWILEDPDVQGQVRRVAKRLSTRCGHSSSDTKDLEQDIRVYLIENEHKYDPYRASVGGYAEALLDSFVKMRIRYRLQQKRRGRLSNRPYMEESTLGSTPTSCLQSDLVDVRDLYQACVDRLSSQEVQVAVLLREAGQVKTAEILRISRRQLRNQMLQIYETCEDLDLSQRKRTSR